MELTAFLRQPRGFDWAAESDCLMWLADWVRLRRGVDAAQPWRGAYRSAIGAARIVRAHGGMTALLDAALAPHGIVRTDDPKRGDIAVVTGDLGETGALVAGGFVAMLSVNGVIIRRMPVLAAWRV